MLDGRKIDDDEGNTCQGKCPLHQTLASLTQLDSGHGSMEPLVVEVGFSREPRYVILDYSPAWTVGYSLPGEKEMEVPQSVNFHLPRSWIGPYGQILQPILTAYLEALLALIIQNPGVYEVGYGAF